jgi:hypothetical protein
MNRFGRMAFLVIRWRRHQRPRVAVALRCIGVSLVLPL